MFSLIVTIISIALVAALALATLYFGGDAFNQGSAKAAAATVVNQAQQISGANTLHYLDNQAYGSVADLVDGDYLSAAPNPGTISKEGAGYAVETATGKITLELAASSVCDAVNAQAGLDATPTDEAGLDNVQFGCFVTGEGEGTVHTFVFK